MGTPLYTLRLPQSVQDELHVMARIYGVSNGRQFVRELLEAVTSADPERIKVFNGRLYRGIGEQMTMKLIAAADEVMHSTVAPAKAAAPRKVVRRKRRKAKAKPSKAV